MDWSWDYALGHTHIRHGMNPCLKGALLMFSGKLNNGDNLKFMVTES